MVRAPKQSNSEIIAAYLDAVMRKDASVIDRFFAPEVEYMVNGTRVPDRAGVLPQFPRIATQRFPGLACIAVERRSRAFWRTCIATWRSSLLVRAR